MSCTFKNTFKPSAKIVLLVLFAFLFQAIAKSDQDIHREKENKTPALVDSSRQLSIAEPVEKKGEFTGLPFSAPWGSHKGGIDPMAPPELIRLDFSPQLKSLGYLSDKTRGFEPISLTGGRSPERVTFVRSPSFVSPDQSLPSSDILQESPSEAQEIVEPSSPEPEFEFEPEPKSTEDKPGEPFPLGEDEDEIDGMIGSVAPATKEEEPDFPFAHFDDTLFGLRKCEEFEWDATGDIKTSQYNEEDDDLFDINFDASGVSTPIPTDEDYDEVDGFLLDLSPYNKSYFQLTWDLNDQESGEDDAGMDEVDSGPRPKLSPVQEEITEQQKQWWKEGEDIESLRTTYMLYRTNDEGVRQVNNNDRPERMVQLKKTETVIQREQESLISQELQGKLARRWENCDPAPETVQVQTLPTLHWKFIPGLALTASAHPPQDTISKKNPLVRMTPSKSGKYQTDPRDFPDAKSTNTGRGHTFGQATRNPDWLYSQK